MRSIFLILRERFKTNKNQFIQLGFAIMLTVFCISLALSLMKIVDKPFDVTFNRLKAAHILLLFDEGQDSSKDLVSWFEQQEEIEHVSAAQPYIVIGDPLIHQDKKIDVDIQLSERIVSDKDFNQLEIIKGDVKAWPEIGEIWLPYHFETVQNVQIGDIIGIPVNGGVYNLKVSAFVIDPHYLSNIFNPTQGWLSPGALSFFLPIEDLSYRMIGVRLNNLSEMESIWGRFVEEFNYTGTDLKYTIFKTAYSGFSKVLSYILILFGAIILLISLIMVRTSIVSHILTDYKQIGVLKSFGFTKSNIILTYIAQFLLLLLIAIPIGLVLSRTATKAILQSTLKDLGITNLNFEFTLVYLISSIIVLVLVALVTFSTAMKGGKINPMQAIRNLSAGKKSLASGRSIFRSRIPLTVILAIRFIRISRASAVSLSLGLVGILLLVLFSANIYNSFDQLKANKSAWGFDNSDLLLNRRTSIILPLNHQELSTILSNEFKNEVKNTITYSDFSVSIIENDVANQKQLFGKVYATEIAKTGLRNLKGEHPVKSDEISLCDGTARNFHKKIGDSIKLSLEGTQKDFKITGVYQDISAFGQGFRLTESAVKNLNPLFEPTSYGLVLNEMTNKDDLKKKLEGQLGETVSVEYSIEARKSIQGLIQSMKLGLVSISTLFILIALILISNDIVIQVKQNRLIINQLKVTGYTSRKLRSVLVVRMLLVLLVSMSIALLLMIVTTQPVSNGLASSIGLVEFPIALSYSRIAVTLLIIVLFNILIAWYSSLSIKKINPRELTDV